MTHQPPLPPAATPPYPPHPAPIAAGDPEEVVSSQSLESEVPTESEGESRSLLIGIGAAVGIGSAALLAATLYARRGSGRRASRSG
jgi:hypothetical protein